MSEIQEIKPKIIRKDLAPRMVPKCTPEIAVREYFLSKFEEHQSKKKPEWDVPRLSPETELVAARRDLTEANQKLLEKREEEKEKRKHMDLQWDELREKEEFFKQEFICFNSFVLENEEKQERIDKRIEEEKELQQQKDEEIRELTKKVAELTEIKETMEEHANKHEMYMTYLQNVLKESDEFQTVFNILNRFEALNANRVELAKQQEKDLELLETAQRDVVNLIDEKAQVTLGLNNQLAELQARYDKAKAEALRWEMAMSHIKNTAAEMSLEQDRVKTSCWNMYQQLCRRRNAPIKLEEGDVEQQLVYIKRSIQDLKKVVHIARQRANREAASTLASPATTQQ